ncbi:hypothetical protein LTS18_009019 [Coniosporium uncinatum]|uniref:Uncharacterized protein n=1 Tax=Coniosporium uncinatum TaxID=93489 RepID=A0ACC3DMF7_9PEZI|nr:hypothetical protein LTS18_009019 [Coniosporium uncinatum]
MARGRVASHVGIIFIEPDGTRIAELENYPRRLLNFLSGTAETQVGAKNITARNAAKLVIVLSPNPSIRSFVVSVLNELLRINDLHKTDSGHMILPDPHWRLADLIKFYEAFQFLGIKKHWLSDAIRKELSKALRTEALLAERAINILRVFAPTDAVVKRVLNTNKFLLPLSRVFLPISSRWSLRMNAIGRSSIRVRD